MYANEPALQPEPCAQAESVMPSITPLGQGSSLAFLVIRPAGPPPIRCLGKSLLEIQTWPRSGSLVSMIHPASRMSRAVKYAIQACGYSAKNISLRCLVSTKRRHFMTPKHIARKDDVPETVERQFCRPRSSEDFDVVADRRVVVRRHRGQGYFSA
jgi:hypothetical protein